MLAFLFGGVMIEMITVWEVTFSENCALLIQLQRVIGIEVLIV